MHARSLVSMAAVVLTIACRVDVRESSRPSPTEFELNELSVAQLQDEMTSGRYTSHRLVQLYLRRIAQIDAAGPRLRSVIETNPDALTIAESLDAERKSKGPRGPLHEDIEGGLAPHPGLTFALSHHRAFAPQASLLFVAQRDERIHRRRAQCWYSAGGKSGHGQQADHGGDRDRVAGADVEEHGIDRLHGDQRDGQTHRQSNHHDSHETAGQ